MTFLGLVGWYSNYHGESVLIFPELLKYLSINEYVQDILGICRQNLIDGALSPALLDTAADLLHRRFTEYTSAIQSLELEYGKKNWQYAERYAGLRQNLELLVDVMSYGTATRVLDDLALAVDNPDPRIAFSAIRLRILNNRPLPRAAVEKIARDPEMRNMLYIACRDWGRTADFPAAYAEHELLAESMLAGWCVASPELRQAPDEIAFGAPVQKARWHNSEAEYFVVFRFRMHEPHVAAQRGWIAGVAQVLDYKGSISGNAMSALAAWDPDNVENYIAEFRDFLRRTKE